MWGVVALIFFSLSSIARAENVLVIGDSHTAGEFGKTLGNVLHQQSDLQVSVAASCGSSPENWLDHSDARYQSFSNKICYATKEPKDAWIKYKGAVTHRRPLPSLPSLMRAKRPHTVVIALGTNSFPEGNDTTISTSARGQIEALIDEVKSNGAACIWIGPPKEPTKGSPYQRKGPGYSLKGQLDYVKMLKETVESKGCTFVNSRTALLSVSEEQRRVQSRSSMGCGGRGRCAYGNSGKGSDE
jgi:hypothetical protein